MKFILIVLYYLSLAQFMNSRKYRLIVSDEIYPYLPETNVASFLEMFSTDNLTFAQIDDDKVLVRGHLEWIRSMDQNLPIQLGVRSQYLQQGTWIEGPLKLIAPDTYYEFTNPSRFWYNLTKLWNVKVCPPQKGDQWIIEEQEVEVFIDLPPSILNGRWRTYNLLTQGIPGFGKYKFGYGFQFELQLV